MVDPNLVPKVRLADGALVPAVGIGTFASDNYTADVVADSRRTRRRPRISPTRPTASKRSSTTWS